VTETGPLGPVASLVARPASWVYAAIVAMRNASFDRGRGVHQLPVPVISIGNITVGGTGKTPLVAWVALRLIECGKRPGIAMRGYRAAVGERGDEEREYELVAPRLPVIAHPKRFDAVSQFLSKHPNAIDCVILDDGFQHRQLARDLDVVLVDAARPGLEGPLLPSGWLREAASSLRRADAVIVTHVDHLDISQAAKLDQQIRSLHGRAPIAWCKHVWRGIDLHSNGGVQRLGTDWLRGKRLLGAFGVGNPRSVRIAYETAGASHITEIVVGDHATYTEKDLRKWRGMVSAAKLDAVAVTRKDWTKIRPLVPVEFPPVVVPDLAIEFTAGETEFAELIARSARMRR